MHVRETTAPHILFIIADDHRFDGIGAYGNPEVSTPILDSLAKEGVLFRNTYVMGSLIGAVCVPSRSCLHTGVNLFQATQSMEINDSRGAMTLKPELKLMPQLFRESGYHTHAIGKWHNDISSFHKSFCSGGQLFFGGMSDHEKVPVHEYNHSGLYPKEDQYIGEQFSTDLFSNEAIRFIENYQEEDPFFLYVAYTSPHDPRTPPESYAQMYDPQTIRLPDNFMPEHPFDNGELYLRGRDEKLAPWPRTDEVIRQHIADYYGMISHMDSRIGDVIHALEAKGLLDNTIIVYTADHGIALGRHGLMGKQNLYDHSIHIPLLISGPGIPKDMQIDALTYGYDLYPTLCEIADIRIPDSVQSESLIPLITGERDKVRDSVFAVFKDVMRTVSDGNWKLIRYYRSDHRNTGANRLQLFHLKEDPMELTDLAGVPEHAAELIRLAEELSVWQSKVNDPLANRSVYINEGVEP